MHMYLDFTSEMAMFTWIFVVVKSNDGVLISPRYSIRFPPAVSLVLWVSVFWGQLLHTALTYVALLSVGLSLWKMNLIVSVPSYSFQPWDRRQSSLHILFDDTGGFIYTKSLFPRVIPVVSQLMWFSNGSTVIVYFLGYVWAMYSEPTCVFDMSIISILNILGVFLNDITWLTLYLLLYLCVTFLAILMPLFPFFLLRYHMGHCYCFIQFYFSKNHFWQFSNFWCNC